MAGTGVDVIFPLWGVSSSDLAAEVGNRSIDAIVACVDSNVVHESFLGLRYDEAFLAALSESVDPCGENGEFHTFVTGHPAFVESLDVQVGAVRPDSRYPSIELRLPPP